MSQVFLSYSNKDREMARKIANELKGEGIDVWFDEWSIHVGDSIVQKIEQGLKESKFLVILLTRSSIESGWVEKEWHNKIEEEAKKRKVVVLPVKGDDSTTPELLKDKKYCDLTKGFEEALRELVTSIRYHIAQRRSEEVSPEKSKQYIKCKIVPINESGFNLVHFGEQKYRNNSEFGFSTTLHFFVEKIALTLLQFEASYWALGCPCLNSWPTLRLDHENLGLMGDFKTLKSPINLPSNSTKIIEYYRELRPPLMNMTSADCDYGDIEVIISYRDQDTTQVSTSKWFFRFSPGGKLEEIPHIRSVPRLHNDELENWKKAGFLSEEEFNRIIRVDPITRYMAVKSDNDTWLTLSHLTRYDKELLRRLLWGDK